MGNENNFVVDSVLIKIKKKHIFTTLNNLRTKTSIKNLHYAELGLSSTPNHPADKKNREKKGVMPSTLGRILKRLKLRSQTQHESISNPKDRV